MTVEVKRSLFLLRVSSHTKRTLVCRPLSVPVWNLGTEDGGPGPGTGLWDGEVRVPPPHRCLSSSGQDGSCADGRCVLPSVRRSRCTTESTPVRLSGGPGGVRGPPGGALSVKRRRRGIRGVVSLWPQGREGLLSREEYSGVPKKLCVEEGR